MTDHKQPEPQAQAGERDYRGLYEEVCVIAQRRLRELAVQDTAIAKKDAALKACKEALEKLLKRDQRNVCLHEATHRGGVNWEICEDCGAMWADDRGGKPKWEEPNEWTAADAAITQAQEAINV